MEQLARSRGEWPEVVKRTGVLYSTLVKIAQGVTENPRFQTLESLADYFKKNKRAA